MEQSPPVFHFAKPENQWPERLYCTLPVAETLSRDRHRRQSRFYPGTGHLQARTPTRKTGRTTAELAHNL